jgi:hypothetical protein
MAKGFACVAFLDSCGKNSGPREEKGLDRIKCIMYKLYKISPLDFEAPCRKFKFPTYLWEVRLTRS